MRGRVLFGIAGAGALVMLGSVTFGLWWLTFVGAIVIGAVVRRPLTAIVAGAILGAFAWGEALAGIQTTYGLGPTAGAIAAIMGFKGAPLVPIVLTVLVGLLLGVSGAWLGSATRSVALSRRWSRPVQKLRDQRLEVKDSVLTKS